MQPGKHPPEASGSDKASRGSLDVKAIRADFPILKKQMTGGKQLIYLDNAATTQKPAAVLDSVEHFYRQSNANVHRSIYQLGEEATRLYEKARSRVARFINAAESRSIVFTSGTTESINLVAYAWARHRLKPGDEILITEMEHHSNIIPWQLTAKDTGATLRYIPITESGLLDLEDPAHYFTSRTKLLAVTHQSNVFGTVNPVSDLVKYAQEVGALVLVDAAQSVPHFPVDVQQLDCDFLAFSGHKMLAPTGIGALYARPELLESMEPFLGGGEMISRVTMEESEWNEIPYKFEAGTPKIAQAVGMEAAMDYIENVGLDAIKAHTDRLAGKAKAALESLPGVTVYGEAAQRGPVLSFNVDSVHPHDLAQFLDQEGIAIRAGHHCAQPIMLRLGVSSTARASFYLYNTESEIDQLCEAIGQAVTFFTAAP